MEDLAAVEPSKPSPATVARWIIIGAFLKSEETEIEVSAENMAAIISSFEKPDVWDLDIAKVEYVKVRRQLQLMSHLNYWPNLEEQIGTIKVNFNGINAVLESRFPVDAEKFYLKKKEASSSKGF